MPRHVNISPEKVLETLGVSNFSIDYDIFRVVLYSKYDFNKLADYFDRQGEGIAFCAYGWLWCCASAGDGHERKMA